MKRCVAFLCLMLTSSLLLSGCVAAIGNRDGSKSGATLGQQLIDLQKAKEAGAISEAEYDVQRSKMLGNK
jgi:hypothetical protein